MVYEYLFIKVRLKTPLPAGVILDCLISSVDGNDSNARPGVPYGIY